MPESGVGAQDEKPETVCLVVRSERRGRVPEGPLGRAVTLGASGSRIPGRRFPLGRSAPWRLERPFRASRP